MINSKRCFHCLKTGHIGKSCPSTVNCRLCGGKYHHKAICFKGLKETRDENPSPREEPEPSPTVTACSKGKGEVLLQTAEAYVYGEDRSKKLLVNLLFDGGSQRSYVTEDVKQKLQLNAEKTELLNLNTFGSEKSERKRCSLVNLNVEVGVDEPPVKISALSYPSICSPINARVDLSDYPHLQGLKLADASLGNRSKRIDVLIGADSYYDLVTGDVRKGNSGPVAVSSKLGWLLAGKCQTYSNVIESNVISNLVLDSVFKTDHGESEEITETLKEFWKHEAQGLKDTMTETGVDDGKSEKPSEMNIEFNGERYVVSLPWKIDCLPFLKDNYALALGRLNTLYSRLKDHPELLKEYDAVFRDQLEKGIIEKVNISHDKGQSKIHFLSHHCVIRCNHDTTKLRVVFDGSAKAGSDSLSLNDCLYQGDNYLPQITISFTRYWDHRRH